jgi:hypothetical protein
MQTDFASENLTEETSLKAWGGGLNINIFNGYDERGKGLG